MKKLLLLLLTLVMTLSVTFGLIACQPRHGDVCVHVYADEYTCHDRECTKCREVIKATAAHTFIDNKLCVCGEYHPEYYTNGLVFSLIEYNYTAYSVEGYEGSSTEVVIPSIYAGKPVLLISYSVFRNCSSLTSVVIGDSVTSIGDSAFEGCSSLTSIVIPNSVTSIGGGAFSDCSSLTSIEIPDSVTSIGNHAFYICSSLTSIEIPDSVTSIGAEAFYNTGYYNNEQNWENGALYIDKYLVEVKTNISGSYSIKEGTLTIADEAFRNCSSLTSIEIPNRATLPSLHPQNNCCTL